MKAKRGWLVATILFITVSLSGCMGVGDMTEEEADLIAEYSAGILLRYSDRYDRRLITAEDREETVTPTEVPSVTATPVAKETPEPELTDDKTPDSDGEKEEPKDTTKQVALNHIYGEDGLDFKYLSYKFCDSYPEKATSIQMTADKGQKLLVLSFAIKNKTAANKKVDFVSRNITYLLDVDGQEFEPTISILENGGLQFLSTTIKGKKTEKAVLVYNLSDEREKASKISLTVKDGDKSHQIQIR